MTSECRVSLKWKLSTCLQSESVTRRQHRRNNLNTKIQTICNTRLVDNKISKQLQSDER